ncbi:MAG: hypothetical protein E7430_09745 [Ruminococcaceae bacterium]|nr:hypothetical protein [Oscillospiraceae bacterium]
MNGIEKIVARIEADSREQCARILERAKAQAEQTVISGEQSAKREYEIAVAESKKSAEERCLRLAGSAESEAKKLILASKQKMLDSAYDLAMDMLCSYPQKTEFLAKLAVKASSTGRESVVMNPLDRQNIGLQVVELANKMLAAEGKTALLTLSDNTRDIRGGFYLSDGDIETNCSFETLINAQRVEGAAETAKVLFG